MSYTNITQKQKFKKIILYGQLMVLTSVSMFVPVVVVPVVVECAVVLCWVIVISKFFSSSDTDFKQQNFSTIFEDHLYTNFYIKIFTKDTYKK